MRRDLHVLLVRGFFHLDPMPEEESTRPTEWRFKDKEELEPVRQIAERPQVLLPEPFNSNERILMVDKEVRIDTRDEIVGHVRDGVVVGGLEKRAAEFGVFDVGNWGAGHHLTHTSSHEAQ
jgi:hypothetical protein